MLINQLRIALLFCGILTANSSFSQLKPVYVFQQDDTVLRRKYYDEALQKKKDVINSFKGDNSKYYKSAYGDMFGSIEDLFSSSRSVTAHAANDYINAIASKIINANPELKNLVLRVVFTRDNPPNAYSLGEGTIVFNAGLFTYLDNEAEMTFVLCHEIAHYYLDHSKKRIDKIVGILTSDSLKKEIKKLEKQEYKVGEQLQNIQKSLLFDIHRHSRDGEEEADRVGLRFFKHTGYEGKAFVDLMQLLDKVDDTVLVTRLDIRKMLSFPSYPFKEKWIKKESVIFGAMSAEDASPLTKKERDSLKTHPDCEKRIALLKDSALTIQGQEYLVNQDLFKKLKMEFIPEITEEAYKEKDLSRNLYFALQMLQQGQYEPLAIYSVARDLNDVYKHQKDHELGLFINTEYRGFSEEYNNVLRMLSRLRLNEVAELNVNFCTFYQDKMNGYAGFEEQLELAKKYQKESE